MTLPTETALRILKHLTRIRDEFAPGTRAMVVIDQQFIEQGVVLGDVEADRAVQIIRRSTAVAKAVVPPPIAQAVSYLRGNGLVVEPTDRQGIYLVDRIEMTTWAVIEAEKNMRRARGERS